MIYMVEHTFDAPQLEGDWNTWYAGNLRVLLAVPGIESAQRFRVPDTAPPRYMAMYTIAGPEVFESEAYRNAGGGGANSLRFRPAYRTWVRNLFANIDAAPEVATGQVLLALDTTEVGDAPPGVNWQWGRAIALHRTTPLRALAVVAQDRATPQLRARDGLTVYAPHGPRLTAIVNSPRSRA